MVGNIPWLPIKWQRAFPNGPDLWHAYVYLTDYRFGPPTSGLSKYVLALWRARPSVGARRDDDVGFQIHLAAAKSIAIHRGLMK